MISRFYEQFSRSSRILGHFWKFEKISNSYSTNISYIILKRVIWRFQMYNLFLDISKFREDKSNNVFREILKCFPKTSSSRPKRIVKPGRCSCGCFCKGSAYPGNVLCDTGSNCLLYSIFQKYIPS